MSRQMNRMECVLFILLTVFLVTIFTFTLYSCGGRKVIKVNGPPVIGETDGNSIFKIGELQVYIENLPIPILESGDEQYALVFLSNCQFKPTNLKIEEIAVVIQEGLHIVRGYTGRTLVSSFFGNFPVIEVVYFEKFDGIVKEGSGVLVPIEKK